MKKPITPSVVITSILTCLFIASFFSAGFIGGVLSNKRREGYMQARAKAGLIAKLPIDVNLIDDDEKSAKAGGYYYLGDLKAISQPRKIGDLVSKSCGVAAIVTCAVLIIALNSGRASKAQQQDLKE